MEELVSVIVPAYNEGEKIAKCLQSVVNQTHKNLEVIVVYKDSQDDTLSEIKSINDSRIKIIEQKEATKVGGARNLGIKESKGDFISFIECEMIEPQFIEKLYSRIVKDNSDIAIGTITLLKPGIVCNLTKHKKDIVLSKLTDKLEEMQTGACFEKLFRAKMIKENNILFPEGLYWEDNAFLLQAIYYSNKISLLTNCNYTWYPQDWDEDYSVLLKESILPIAKIMTNFAKEKSFSRKEMNILRLKMFKNFGKSFILKDDIYKQFVKITGFSWSVAYRYWQMRKREWRKKICS